MYRGIVFGVRVWYNNPIELYSGRIVCTHRDIAKIISLAAAGVPVADIAVNRGVDVEVVIQVLEQYQVDYEPMEMDHYILKPKLVSNG